MEPLRDAGRASAMPMQSVNEVFFQLLQAGECGASTLAALRYADQDLQELITTHVMARVAHGYRYTCQEDDMAVDQKTVRRVIAENLLWAANCFARAAMIAELPYPTLLREEARGHAAWLALHTRDAACSETEAAAMEMIVTEHLHPRERAFAVSKLTERCFETHDVLAALVRALRVCGSNVAYDVQATFGATTLQFLPRDHPDAAELVRRLIPHVMIRDLFSAVPLLTPVRHFGLTSLLFDNLPALLSGIADEVVGINGWVEFMEFLARNAPDEVTARIIIEYLERTVGEVNHALSLLSLLRFRSCRERLLPLLAVSMSKALLRRFLSVVDGDGDARVLIQLLNREVNLYDIYDVAVVAGAERMEGVAPAVLASDCRNSAEGVIAIAAAVATHGTAAQCDALVDVLRAAYATKGETDVTMFEAMCWEAPQFRRVLLEHLSRSSWQVEFCRNCTSAVEPMADVLVRNLERVMYVKFACRGLLYILYCRKCVLVTYADRICLFLASQAVEQADPWNVSSLLCLFLQSADVSDSTKLALVTGYGFRLVVENSKGLTLLIDAVPTKFLHSALLALSTKEDQPNFAVAQLRALAELAGRSGEGAASVVREHRELALRLAANRDSGLRLPLALAINGGRDGVALSRELLAKAVVYHDDPDYEPLMKLIA